MLWDWESPIMGNNNETRGGIREQHWIWLGRLQIPTPSPSSLPLCKMMHLSRQKASNHDKTEISLETLDICELAHLLHTFYALRQSKRFVPARAPRVILQSNFAFLRGKWLCLFFFGISLFVCLLVWSRLAPLILSRTSLWSNWMLRDMMPCNVCDIFNVAQIFLQIVCHVKS